MTYQVPLKDIRFVLSELAELPAVVVAFSGGVDSAFLLRVAVDALGALRAFLDIALAQASQLNQLLGGAPLDLQRERGDLFRILGFSNVFTLGVLCALLAWDVRQNRALIPVFVVLKGGSALGYLYTFLLGPTRPPLFLTAFFWDGLAVFLVVFFSRRALNALGA